MSIFLVTGASGGIGSAVCQRLASSGHQLLLTARDAGRLLSLRHDLPGEGHQIIAVDMSSDQSIAVFATQLESLKVRLDGAVLMPPQPQAEKDPLPDADLWRELFQTSFIGPLATLKAAIAQMRPDVAAGHRAKIVIISGISSAQVLGHYATGNVIRTAWLGQAKALAFALGERNIHVNTLSLGGTLTPVYREAIAKRATAAGRSYEGQLLVETDNIPLHKYGQPSEVAAVVEGLLSPLSDHMTGLNILHDGGFTRAY